MITKQKFALLFVAGFILTKNDFQSRPFTHAAQSPKVIQPLPVQVFSTAPAAPCPAVFTPSAALAPVPTVPAAGVSTDTKRTREEAMESLGITEEMLGNLTPEQRAEVEKGIADYQPEDDADQESGFNGGSLCNKKLIGSIVAIAIVAYVAYSPERRAVIKEFLQSIKSKLPESAQGFIDSALSQMSALPSTISTAAPDATTPSALAEPLAVPTPPVTTPLAGQAPVVQPITPPLPDAPPATPPAGQAQPITPPVPETPPATPPTEIIIIPPTAEPGSAPQESQPQDTGFLRRPAAFVKGLLEAAAMVST